MITSADVQQASNILWSIIKQHIESNRKVR